MDLFSQSQNHTLQPLAEQLRPKDLESFYGQKTLFSSQRGVFSSFLNGKMQSLIFWGPPGCGKTTLAKILVEGSGACPIEENAIDLGAKRIRTIGDDGKKQLLENQTKTVLFVDEIHRLNKGQQDVLLPYLEKGYFYLIGATTENPSYELNAALMSRCRLVVFEGLAEDALEQVLQKVCEVKKWNIEDLLTGPSVKKLCSLAKGDARNLIGMMEELQNYFDEVSLQAKELSLPLDVESLGMVLGNQAIAFDKNGDQHYDTISAFIKSIRGSDPDGGVYYLARLLEGGEDLMFIARRLIVLASEDIGNADPRALSIAVSGMEAVKFVGMPEAEIILSQVVTYLASAPKSNRSYLAIKKARKLVRESGYANIPKSLRSSRTQLMKGQGYGVDYRYPHEGERGWLPQDYLPKALKGSKFYEPSPRGFEKQISAYLKWLRQK